MTNRKVKYTDYNGVEREETLYFNMTQTDLMELQDENPEFSLPMLQALMNSEDAHLMFKVIRKLIVFSYGEKDPAGKYHLKTEEIQTKFAHSLAYEQLLHDLFETNEPKTLTEFLLGIFPAKLAEEIRAQQSKVVPLVQG